MNLPQLTVSTVDTNLSSSRNQHFHQALLLLRYVRTNYNSENISSGFPMYSTYRISEILYIRDDIVSSRIYIPLWSFQCSLAGDLCVA
jgi:hypothetical protein